MKVALNKQNRLYTAPCRLRVERIDSLHFLSGCHKSRLNSGRWFVDGDDLTVCLTAPVVSITSIVLSSNHHRHSLFRRSSHTHITYKHWTRNTITQDAMKDKTDRAGHNKSKDKKHHTHNNTHLDKCYLHRPIRSRMLLAYPSCPGREMSVVLVSRFLSASSLKVKVKSSVLHKRV